MCGYDRKSVIVVDSPLSGGVVQGCDFIGGLLKRVKCGVKSHRI